ncbi:MAG TPA: glycine betaine ABC transporter substrate-binding protein [Bryocella sp.]|nr:glycine betaine ABC transporter substrate-binding protein [Bryocella sp.]
MDRRTFLSGVALAVGTGCTLSSGELTVGSKNFTEQLILGEILKQSLESACHAPVEGRFYLAGTYICQQAILAGRIDTYVEYTGTAMAAILKDRISGDAASVLESVRQQYKRRFNLEVMPPLGFNNSFAMVMRPDESRTLGVKTLSELAPVSPQLKLGVGYEFLERADGYQGLVRTYGLRFAEAPRVMDLGLLYRALENKSVDIVAGNNTDGLIAARGLVVLEDDKHYFPPYDAVPIVRPELFDKCAQAQKTFAALAGRISADQMRAMNYAVDGQKKDAAAVAHDFLARIATNENPRPSKSASTPTCAKSALVGDPGLDGAPS